MAKDKAFYQKGSLNLGGQLYSMEEPLIMGILNLNPDSFYDGGRYLEVDKALAQAQKMIGEGADIIDLGPASSKPGSALISPEQEWKILQPVLRSLRAEFPNTPISIDTYNAATAEKSVVAGASLINDISGGGFDAKMLPFIGESQTAYVMMHMQGKPETMQLAPSYENVVNEVALFFSEQLEKLAAYGASDVILDLGFGFGKTLEHNYRLFNHIPYFKALFQLPILVGISRKSMLYKVIGTTAKAALNVSTAMHSIALQNGASILRVHDVREAVEVRKIITFNQKFA